MNRRIVLKRLTASDLTLFDWHFRNNNAGNQKALNLNADVFVEVLYPALPALSVGAGGRIPLDVSIFGPGLAGLHNLQRKIVKGAAYKNWRLNGELIYNPDEEPTRYNVLRPDDLVLMEFSGAAVPDAVTLVFLARAITEDSSLHSLLDDFLASRRMAALELDTFRDLVSRAEVLETHPVHRLKPSADLEEVVLGGGAATRRIYASAARRAVGRAELLRARSTADENGRLGEELVNDYLLALARLGELESVEWVSDKNAVAPFDFRLHDADGTEVLVDVKSTCGEFSRPIHLSYNEILQIANGSLRYDIYRVHSLSSSSGRLRIANNVRALGVAIFEAFAALPDGVVPDSVSVSPEKLSWSPDLPLEPTGEDDA